MNKYGLLLFLAVTVLGLGAACSSPSPSAVLANATPHPELVATAQAQQYELLAQGTIQAQQATADYWQAQQAILAQNLAGTAAADATRAAADATRMAGDMRATATMQALAMAQAQADATSAAVGTAQAQAVQATATGAAVQATATMQALAMARAESDARRGQAASYFYTVGVGVLFVFALIALWLIFPVIRARAGVVTYGTAKNPLILHTSGRGRLSLLNPLTMLSAGATIDQRGQIDQMAAGNEQLQILLAGGLQNLMAAQAQYQPQINRTISIGGTTTTTTSGGGRQPLRLTATSPAGGPVLAAVPSSADNQPVPLSAIARQISAGHVLLVGETGAGKTTAATQLATIRTAAGQNVVVIDPHAKAGQWADYEVVGRGRDYDAIVARLAGVQNEFNGRYQRLAHDGAAVFRPMTLLVDELPAIAQNAPAAVDVLKMLLMEARKVNIWILALTQQTNVSALNIKGQSQVLNNFRYVIKLGEFAESGLVGGGAKAPAPAPAGTASITSGRALFAV